jgi:hypothetical protein
MSLWNSNTPELKRRIWKFREEKKSPYLWFENMDGVESLSPNKEASEHNKDALKILSKNDSQLRILHQYYHVCE